MSDSDGSDEGNSMMPMGMEGMENGMGYEPQMQSEEHLWMGELSSKNRILKYDGCDDADSTLILHRVTLGADCTDETRHVVKVISLDHQDNRIEGTLCSLKLNGQCSVSVGGVNLAPPSALKLVKGTGPLTVVGNLMKMVDGSLLEEDSDEMEEAEEEEPIEDARNELDEVKINAKIESIRNGKTDEAKDDTDDSVDESEDDEPQAKKPKVNDEEPQAKKPKVTQKAKVTQQPKKVDVKKDSTDKKEDKSKKIYKKFSNVEEFVKAINEFKGGKPKKEAKFKNWCKHTFKMENENWIKKAWTSVNK